MKVHMVCPAPAGSRKGNRVSAERWARLLEQLGHAVIIADAWCGQACDVLWALHARKSYPSIRAYRRAHPAAPLVVALTGTDLYRDLPRSQQAWRSLQWADRLIGLHDAIYDDLPRELHAKARVIWQSVLPITPRPVRGGRTFNVCVLGHLRHEKDPLRTAWALRQLPHLPRLRVVQAGQALSPRYAQWVGSAMQHDARYRWLGEISRPRALRLLATSHLMVISSHMEGGANVVSEAIVNRVPVLASDIPGNRGLLGQDYRGYFPTANTEALAQLLEQACCDRRYYQGLQTAVARRAERFAPQVELANLAALMREL